MKMDGKIFLAAFATVASGAYLFSVWQQRRKVEEEVLDAYGVPKGIKPKDVKEMSDKEIDELADKAVQNKLITLFD